jgi:hypothetical protein
MFCAPVLIFGGTEGVASHFHVLHARTRYRMYRGRPVQFSCFARPDSFSTVPRASGPVFMFCAPRLVFDGNECLGSRFHNFRALTHFLRYRWRWVPFSCFRRYRGRRVPISCFALPDSFSAVPMASGPFFMFCAPRHTHFRRYRGRRVQFTYFARPDTFSAEPRASNTVLISCSPGHVFGGTEGVGSLFTFCAPRLIFGSTEGVGYCFHVFSARSRF